MAKIELVDVTIDIPVYNVRGRSLKSMVFQRAIGGNVRARDRGDAVIVRALDKVSATFSSGDRIGLIGHNGAGVLPGEGADVRVDGETRDIHFEACEIKGAISAGPKADLPDVTGVSAMIEAGG